MSFAQICLKQALRMYYLLQHSEKAKNGQKADHFISGKQLPKRPNLADLADLAFLKAKWQSCSLVTQTRRGELLQYRVISKNV